MKQERSDIYQTAGPEAVQTARRMLRTARHGALATLEEKSGWPLASRVSVATDTDGAPLILVSALAAHSSALAADRRCSLLLGEPGRGDPLAHPRLLLICRARRLERQSEDGKRAARRFLNRHPKARLYADLADFSHFRLQPERALLNAGFAKAFKMTGQDLLLQGAGVAAIAAAEQGALDHLNSDHREALGLIARHFAGAKGEGWRAIALDPEGIDLARGDETRRAVFPLIANKAADLRRNLVDMTVRARAGT
jgi:putative heme iron utilization protein